MTNAAPRLAFRLQEGTGPTIMFLPGYKSDMMGSKAVALAEWAAREGRAMLRFDYSGCGESEGAFEDGTLTQWRDDALSMIDRAIEGPVVLVGSSMGGWLMLLVALARPDRVVGMVGIAAAPDFTDWGFNQDQKLEILSKGRVARPSDYGEPLVTTRAFWQSGEANRVLHGPIPIDVPVRLIQGQADRDVPWRTAEFLAEKLRSSDVQVTFVKDGDHRLSRDADLGLLIRTVDALTRPS